LNDEIDEVDEEIQKKITRSGKMIKKKNKKLNHKKLTIKLLIIYINRILLNNVMYY